MNPSVREAITWSAAAMQDVVWPAIGPRVGGGRLVPVETVTSRGFARELDLMAGIDAWQIIDSRGIVRGLASRVQQGKDWSTFTIRYRLPSGRPTEFHKRAAEIDAKDGRLGPHLICQAYVTNKTCPILLSAAIARMSDVIALIRMTDLAEERKEPGGAVFKVIRWSHLRSLGAPLVIWPPNGSEVP